MEVIGINLTFLINYCNSGYMGHYIAGNFELHVKFECEAPKVRAESTNSTKMSMYVYTYIYVFCCF